MIVVESPIVTLRSDDMRQNTMSPDVMTTSFMKQLCISNCPVVGNDFKKVRKKQKAKKPRPEHFWKMRELDNICELLHNIRPRGSI